MHNTMQMTLGEKMAVSGAPPIQKAAQDKKEKKGKKSNRRPQKSAVKSAKTLTL